MRWLTVRSLCRDDGAVAVVVALLMVVFLGFAAISVDVGGLYAERRQMQNGADSAALAVAQDTACKAPSTPTTSTTESLARANVNDNFADASAPDFSKQSASDPTTNLVTVRTWATLDSAGTPGKRNSFAGVFGSQFDSTQVKASATASCGHPLGGPAFLPLTFNQCHFAYTANPQLIRYDNNAAANCGGTTMGTAIPGGFGWLHRAGGGCSAQINSTTSWAPSDPGNDFPLVCEGTLLAKIKNAVILIPMYDTTTGTGSGGGFHIVGFAAFKITGYRFSGQPILNWSDPSGGQPTCTGNCRGIIGNFVSNVTLNQDYSLGGSDFGATVVGLAK